ncbi:hypothetical protein C8Q75DRAFT_740370 [Abortiporus biennis]|nr:hypothetical protein C8Q75DRAFT_740370 [Abortiporus biennis]
MATEERKKRLCDTAMSEEIQLALSAEAEVTSRKTKRPRITSNKPKSQDTSFSNHSTSSKITSKATTFTQSSDRIFDGIVNMAASSSNTSLMSQVDSSHSKSRSETSRIDTRSLSPLSPLSDTPSAIKGWDLSDIVQQGRSTVAVHRISIFDQDLVGEIERHERAGRPLIVEDCHHHEKWPKDMFNADWLLTNQGDTDMNVRNIHNRSDKHVTLKDFITYSRNAVSAKEVPAELLYAKDSPCPPEWKEWLHSMVLPDLVCPNNEDNLLQHLEGIENVETLLCYLGIGDTYTPFHKDLCGSSGHNLMCYTEDSGGAFWFLTESSEAPLVASYFQSKIGTELDWEDYVAKPDSLIDVPFKVYAAQQKLGDLMLIPPRSCHQVVNLGGLTIKMSWSRMTIDGLETAYHHELPIYQRVCRAEQYRVRKIVHRSIIQTYKSMHKLIDEGRTHEVKSYKRDGFKKLLRLFDIILYEAYVQDYGTLPCIATANPDIDPFLAYNLSCDFCGADIFQSFFECPSCGTPSDHDDDSDSSGGIGCGLLICPMCYVEGRTCFCGDMHAAQVGKLDELLKTRNEAFKVYATVKGRKQKSPLTEIEIMLDDRVKIFDAACALLHSRTQTGSKLENDRSCRYKGVSHPVPYIFTVSCTKCHSAKCFEHILECGVHSAEAIHIRTRKGDWHDTHINRKVLFRIRRDEVQEAEKTGKPVDLYVKLVIMAESYTLCKPISTKVVRGWYDETPLYLTTTLQYPASPTEKNLPGSNSDIELELAPTSPEISLQVAMEADEQPPAPSIQESPISDTLLREIQEQIKQLQEKATNHEEETRILKSKNEILEDRVQTLESEVAIYKESSDKWQKEAEYFRRVHQDMLAAGWRGVGNASTSYGLPMSINNAQGEGPSSIPNHPEGGNRTFGDSQNESQPNMSPVASTSALGNNYSNPPYLNTRNSSNMRQDGYIPLGPNNSTYNSNNRFNNSYRGRRGYNSSQQYPNGSNRYPHPSGGFPSRP